MINPNITQRFTKYLNDAFIDARKIAAILNSPEITPEHLFCGLSSIKGSLSKEILDRIGIIAERVKILFFISSKSGFPKHPGEKIINERMKNITLSSSTKKILTKAVLIAAQNQHKYIGTEHLLYAIVQADLPSFKKIWKDKRIGMDIDLEYLKKQIKNILKTTSKFSELTAPFTNQRMKHSLVNKNSAINFFCTELTDPKNQKFIDPVIGRVDEINRLIDILSRKTKNNPVLIGDPGVGKTAIVEGLAKKIALGQAPTILINKKIFTLDLNAVVAGTTYRGEFEMRFKQIIDEVKKDPNIILFIDEIHTLVGTGNAQGSLDAANILKPALAHGEIHLIGATTLSEYKKYIEEESALERRFQPILVNEPSIETTFQFLKGLKNNYETFHQVFITDEALQAACVLSEQYIPSKFLPDKAIDLIDETASRIKVANTKNEVLKEIKKLENELENIEEKKKEAILKEDFKEAFILKERSDKILQEINMLYDKKNKKKILGKITEKEIRETISKMTKIPIQKLASDEKKQLIDLEKTLHEKIINQDQAIKEISKCIRCSRLGLMPSNRPLGSFLFLGPSGIGKTECAKILAETIFIDKDAFIRIDMSEFNESFNISKLIGAPAGYVGYKEKGILTDAVKTRPYSLILLDEVEKAHPNVLNLLLQVLEDGHLTDSVGRKINFKNTIIIMTSNVGIEKFNQCANIGFGTNDKNEEQKEIYKQAKKEILKELPTHFRPEFLNRIDKILVFQPLNADDLEKITILQIKELNKNLATKDLKLELTDEAIKFIAKKSFVPEQGARLIRQTIQNLIINKIAQKMLEDKFKDNQTIRVYVADKKIVLK